MTFLPRHNSPSSHEALRDIKHPAQLRLRYGLVDGRPTLNLRGPDYWHHVAPPFLSPVIPTTVIKTKSGSTAGPPRTLLIVGVATWGWRLVATATSATRCLVSLIQVAIQVSNDCRHVPGYHAYAVL